MIPNVLAARYASPELVAIWSPENKIVLERRLWIAVLRAQRDSARSMGLTDPIDELITTAGARNILIRALQRHAELFIVALFEKNPGAAKSFRVEGMTVKDWVDHPVPAVIAFSLVALVVLAVGLRASNPVVPERPTPDS